MATETPAPRLDISPGAPTTAGPHKRMITVAVDNSKACFEACQWAVDHLYREGDHFHLLHITDETPGVHEERDLSKIDSSFVKLLESRQVPYTIEVGRTPKRTNADAVGDMLCKRAQLLNSMCMIVASHTKGKLKTMFTGSVTQYVVHHSTVPVLVMREEMLGHELTGAPGTTAPHLGTGVGGTKEQTGVSATKEHTGGLAQPEGVTAI